MFQFCRSWNLCWKSGGGGGLP